MDAEDPIESHPSEARIRSDLKKGAALLCAGEMKDAEAAFAKLDRDAEDARQPECARVQIELAIAKSYLAWLNALVSEGRYSEALSGGDVVLQRYAAHPPPGNKDWIARAMRLRAVALRHSGRHEEAETVLRQLVSETGGADDVDSGDVVAMALNDLAALRRSAGDTDAAIAIYDELERRFGGAAESKARRAVVAALRNKAILLRRGGDNRAALEAIDRLLARTRDDRGEQARDMVVEASSLRAAMLRSLGRREEAAREREGLLAALNGITTGRSRNWAAQALSEEAAALFEDGRHDKAAAVNDRLIEMARSDPDGELRRFLAVALSARALMLEDAQRWTDLDGVYCEMLSLFDGASDKGTAEQVVRAFTRSVIALRAQGQYDQALHRCEEMWSAFSNLDPREAASADLARLRLEQIELLQLIGSSAAAAADDAKPLLADPELPEGLRARLMSASAAAYVDSERFRDAVVVADQLVQTMGGSEDEITRRQVSLAVVNKLMALAAMGSHDDLRRAYDDMIQRFGEQVGDVLHAVVEELRPRIDARSRLRLATLLYTQATVLRDLGRDDEARTAAGVLIEEYAEKTDGPSGAENASLRKLVAGTRAILKDMEE
jgi:tetratricopeptide (TPR) repeat protein